MKKLLLFCLLFPSLVLAQRYSVSGYVTDQESGESLIGANIFNPLTKEGTTSNTYGFYSLTLSGDSIQLRYSYVGYQSQQIALKLKKDTLLNVKLLPLNQLKEVIITSEQPIEENTQMSQIDIPIAQIKSLPALLGEVDVLKVLQLLPGVQSGTEGSSGIYVRGGGPDQNLILLDGVPVYNASHLFGFFSVFNADAINKVELIKGGFPARYGGRLSSVIDISMKEGNMNEFHGEGGIGLISSRLTLEGPIAKNKASFIVSARRTYLDVLARPLIKMQSEGDVTAGYYFYDLNGKINYKFSDKDRIYLSTYMGDDRFYARDKYEYTFENTKQESKENFGFNWGNITTALRWNHMINSKLFSNTSLTYGRYRFNLYAEGEDKTTTEGKVEKNEYYMEYFSGIRDFAAKVDFDYLPTPDHFIKAGVNVTHHKFSPGAFGFENVFDEELGDIGAEPTYAIEHAVYVEDDYKISELLKINAGLHYSGFAVRGTNYHSLQPRLSARYLLQPSLSLKASYARMAQFIHLLTNSGVGLPTDLWVPVTDKIKPQTSQQVAMGLAKTINSKYEVSLEGYYKKMDNLIEYKEGASFFNLDKNWENKVTSGIGWSYGVEAFLQQKTGRTTGWLGYTLSWTNRQFDNPRQEDRLNNGEIFPYKYDRSHDFSFVVSHKINERTELSGTWVYGTGNAITLPTGSYLPAPDPTSPYQPTYDRFSPWQNVNNYSKRNEYRMPHYHRLDVGLTRIKKTKWGERRWVFGVYNAYNRQNPFFIDVGYQEGKTTFVQYSIFQIIPSISYNFSF